MKFNNVQAIIFDMDGTILDSEPTWQKALHGLLEEKTKTLIPQENFLTFNQSLIGVSPQVAMSVVKKEFTLMEQPEELFKDLLARVELLFSNSVTFIGGFEAFHASLRAAGIPSSIATNAPLTTLQRLTQTMSLQDYFGEHLYSAGHVNNKFKPEPDLFLYAASQLGVKPEHCVVFEDSEAGFHAARAAGMRCIAIKNHTNMHLLSQVDAAISHYDDAHSVLDMLEAVALKDKQPVVGL